MDTMPRKKANYEDRASERWQSIAWIQANTTGNYRVMTPDGKFIGMIWGRTLRRLIGGDVKGCPIVSDIKGEEKYDYSDV